MQKKYTWRMFSTILVAVLLILSTGSTFYIGWSKGAEPDTGTLLIELDNRKQLSDLKKIGDVVVDYHNGRVLVEAPKRKMSRLKKSYNTRLNESRDKIHLNIRDQVFDRREGHPELSSDLMKKNDAYIVQFIGPVKSTSWSERVEKAGASIEQEMQNNALLVQMDKKTKSRVKDLDIVDWVGPYYSGYKISPGLTDSTGKIEVQVTTWDSGDDELVRKKLESMGATFRRHNGVGNIVRLDSSLVSEVAAMPEVRRIDPYTRPQLHDNAANEIHHVQEGWYTSWSGLPNRLTGSGEVVGIQDTGFDEGNADDGNPDFFDGPEGDRVIRYNDRTGKSDPDGVNIGVAHGSHCAGIVGGTGYNWEKYMGEDTSDKEWHKSEATGVAPEVKFSLDGTVDGNPMWGYYPATDHTYWDDQESDGARIFSNSWGAGIGDYNADSENIDDRLDPYVDNGSTMTHAGENIILFSAGNAGPDLHTMSPRPMAKNGLAIGASQNYRPGEYMNAENPDYVADFSSRGGPQNSSGRLKPDLLAVGTAQISALGSGEYDYNGGENQSSYITQVDEYDHDQAAPGQDGLPDYQYMQGTSMACPQAAGMTALVREYYREIEGIANPSNPLVKATMINGADRMDPDLYDYPGYAQGWGRINLQKSLYPEAPQTNQYAEGSFTTTGSWSAKTDGNMNLQVESDEVPLKASLVWIDSSGETLNRQLHFEATSPSGDVHVSNDYNSTGWTRANTGASPDTVNNTQRIEVKNPETGEWSFTVYGDSIPSQADFALVTSGDFGPKDTYDVDLQTEYPTTMSIVSGGQTHLPIEVTNFGSTTDTISLSDDSSADFTVSYAPTSSVPLGSRNKTTLETTIKAATGLSEGVHEFTINGTSAGDPTVKDSIHIKIQVLTDPVPPKTIVANSSADERFADVLTFKDSGGTPWIFVTYRELTPAGERVRIKYSQLGSDGKPISWNGPYAPQAGMSDPKEPSWLKLLHIPSGTYEDRVIAYWQNGTDGGMGTISRCVWADHGSYSSWNGPSVIDDNHGSGSNNLKRGSYMLYRDDGTSDGELTYVFGHIDIASDGSLSGIGLGYTTSADGGQTWNAASDVSGATSGDGNYYFLPSGVTDQNNVNWHFYYYKTSSGESRKVVAKLQDNNGWSSAVDVAGDLSNSDNHQYPRAAHLNNSGTNEVYMSCVYDNFGDYLDLSTSYIQGDYSSSSPPSSTDFSTQNHVAGGDISDAGMYESDVFGMTTTSDGTVWTSYQETETPFDSINLDSVRSSDHYSSTTLDKVTRDNYGKMNPQMSSVTISGNSYAYLTYHSNHGTIDNVDYQIYLTVYNRTWKSSPDSTGPNTDRVYAQPNPLNLSKTSTFNLSATLDDTETGFSTIQDAEWIASNTSDPTTIDWSSADSMTISGSSEIENAIATDISVPNDWKPNNTYRVWVRGQDSAGNWGTDRAGYVDIKVISGGLKNTAPTVDLTRPDAGEVFTINTTETIWWNMSDNQDGNTELRVDLYYSNDSGNSWNAIDTGLAGSADPNSYDWTVPDDQSTNCLVKVNVTDTWGTNSSDQSVSTFTIQNTNPTVDLTRPDGGETFSAGSTETIWWNMSDTQDKNNELTFGLYYSNDSGSSWNTITKGLTGTSNPNSYDWTVPADLSSNCLVQAIVTDTHGATASDQSAGTFEILDAAKPEIENVSESPDPQISGNNVNITCNVTDNHQLYNVWMNITHPDGTNTNVSMDAASGTGWYYNSSYSQAGLHNYTIWANDTSGNWNSSSQYNFTIQSPPTANDDYNTTDEDTSVWCDVLANDSDPDGSLDPSTVTIVSGPSHGSVNKNTSTGEVEYTPNADYSGSDSFTYTVDDNDGLTSNEATVYITVNEINDPPTANDDTNTTDEDTTGWFYILSNDNDVDGTIDASTVSIQSGVSHGSTTIHSNGTVEYTPDPDYSGSDSFTYTVDDNDGATSNTATVSITVNEINDPPVANDDTNTTDEDTTGWFYILSNDSDVDGTIDTSTVTIQTGVSHGSTTVHSNGTVEYTPDPDYSGSDSFTYTVDDNDGATSNTATVSITVNEINDSPVANDDTNTTDEDTSGWFYILSNDNDVDGTIDASTVTIQTGVSHGSTTVHSNGTVEYTPDPDYSGSDSFTYTVDDNDGATSNTATVSITVNEINDPPVANDDYNNTDEDTTVWCDVLANDTDIDGTLDPSTVTVTSGPSHGSTSVNTTTGEIEYTPDTDYYGSDSFNYTVNDNDGTVSNEVTVFLTVNEVNDPPTANDDTNSTDEDTTGWFYILSNDNDVDGTIDTSTVTIQSGVSHGSTTVHSNGTVEYTPDPDYSGSDSFTYTVDDNDGATSNTATVSITVNEINDPPVANDDTNSTDEDTTGWFVIIANDDDIDGSIDGSTVSIQTDVSHGTTTVHGNGTVEYNPNTEYSGSDSFTYTVDDNDGATSNTATVSITVNEINDPPVANDDTNTTDEDTTGWFYILSNDSDVDGTIDTSTVTIQTGVSHGSTTVHSNGTVEYTPDPDYSGSDSFTYTVDDNDGATSNTATVSITVNEINDPPVANDDTNTTDEDTTGWFYILSNDTDVDGNIDASTLAIQTGVSHGSTTVHSNGTVQYTPDADYYGSDSFTYTVNDNDGATSNTATVSITVNEINDPPVANDDTNTTDEDTTGWFYILSNDTDVDGTIDGSTVSIISDVSHGSTTVHSNGTVEYTPTANYFGSDSFTYTVKDDDGATSNTATVDITVTEINDPPTANDDYNTTDEDTSVWCDVLANDTDVDGTLDPSTVTVTSGPSHGSTSVNSTTGEIEYTPNTDYVGSDSFTYTVDDNDGDTSNTAKVYIDVIDTTSPNADAGGPYSGDEDTTISFDGSNSTDNDAIATYEWDWTNDGTYEGSGMTPSHTYPDPGTYTVKLRVTDDAGNTDTDTTTVMVNDTTPPQINNVQAQPDPQEPGQWVNISCDVTDNYQLYGVWVNVTFPDGSSINNTMNQASGDTWYFNNTYPDLGTYNYTIWANDTQDNWNSSVSSFNIEDDTGPEISDVKDSPDPQEEDGYVNITCNVTDNFDLSEVWVNITYPDGSSVNTTMNSSTGDSWYYNDTYSQSGGYHYTVWANDTSDNWNSSDSYTFNIEGNITDVKAVPNPQETGGDVNISCNVTVYEATDVWVNITYPDGSWSNNTMVAGAGDRWYNKSNYVDLGTYSYDIIVRNASGVWTTAPGYSFSIEDTTSPEITNVSDSPDLQETGEYVNITCDVTDNYQVDTVLVEITYPDSSTAWYPMQHGSGDTWYYNDTYTDLGSYSYTIWANDTSDNDNLTTGDGFTIQDTIAPTADAGGPYSGDEDTSISFDGSNSTDNGNIVQYEWDWTDDGTYDTTGISPTHTYLDPGTYTVRLRVTDDAGNTDTDTTTVTVYDVTPPNADAGGPYSGDEDTAISFDGSNSTDNGNIVLYEWDWTDDGTYDTTGISPTHTYVDPGTYTVRLRVTDGGGNTDTNTTTVTVYDVTPPNADAGGPYSGDEDTAISFDGSNSTDNGNIVQYEWDLDNDGSYDDATGITASKVWNTPGTYTIGLRVTDDGGNTDTNTTTVTVYDVTAPIADPGGPYSGNEDTAISFDASNSSDNVGITLYEWDWTNDGTYDSTGVSPTHTYPDPGTYTVKLRVTDGAGNTDTNTTNVTVYDVTPPIADAGGPYTGNEDTSISFDGSNSSDNDMIVSYEWDLDNDGSYDDGTGVTASKTWNTPGTYTIGLRVTDDAGNTDNDTTTVTVFDITPPEITDVQDEPDPQESGYHVNITCNVTDNYQLDEVWLNITRPDGSTTNVSMISAGGIEWYYNSTFNSLGVYDYTIWANDTSDNWNSSAEQNFTIQDTIPPEITNVTATPDPQQSGGSVNISCDVTDNHQIHGVWVNITYPNGTHSNQSMMSGVGDNWYYESTYAQLGTYDYYIWANDTVGNGNSSTGYTFVIEDMTDPVISNVTDKPDPQNEGGYVNISCDATDNYQLYGVWVNITYPDGSWVNTTMDHLSGDTWYHNDTYNQTGAYHYVIWANDTQGNWENSAVHTFDIEGNITDVEALPDPQQTGGAVNISCNVTTVNVAEVWVNVTYPDGSWSNNSMVSGQGNEWYNESTYVDIGIYSYSILVRNTSGVWTKSQGHTFRVVDITPPEISNVTDSPDPQETGEYVNITSNVTDNYQLTEVWVNITHPDGSYTNSSLTHLSGDTWYYNGTFTVIGTHQYTIWATDLSGNWNSSSGHNFTIRDITPPEIIDVNDSPDPQETGEYVNITCEVTDNYQLYGVWINITYPDGSYTNDSMLYLSGDTWYYNSSYTDLGVYNYSIWANDTSDNWNSSVGYNFTIVDTIPPMISNVTDDPDPQLSGGYVNITSDVFDNYKVDSVWVNITYPDGSHLNSSMVHGMGNRWYLNTTYNQLGTYQYTIWANDTENNWNSSSEHQFLIEGDISDVKAVPDPQEAGGPVNISCNVTISNLGGVWVNITYPDGTWENKSMVSGQGSTWYNESIYHDLGVYDYKISAHDLSGNWVTSSGYNFTIQDTTVPLITNVSDSPDPQETGGNVNITCDVTDNYQVSEVWINITYPDGTWYNTTMDHLSGSNWHYESPYIDLGTYQYTILADDTENNWNSSSGHTFTIVDTTPPEIINVNDSPDPQETGGNVNITCDVTDNYQLYGVWVNITYPDGSYVNASMTQGTGNGWYYEAPYIDLGTYQYTIWANDTENNWNSSSGHSFTIVDTTPPEITNVNDSPDPQLTGREVNITCNVTDNHQVSEVRVNITYPDGGWINTTMVHLSGDTWYYQAPYIDLGTYHYDIWADDTEDNWNTSTDHTFFIYGYDLTVSSTSGGSVIMPGEGNFSYNASEVVYLEAVSQTDYHFVEWTGDNGTIGDTTDNSTTITMNGNYTITAEFAIDTYTLSISSTSGGDVTVPGEGTFNYNAGEIVDLQAVGNSGYQFVEWTGDNTTIADTKSSSTTITIDADYTITAEFTVTGYDLTISSTSGGNVTAPGEGTFSYEAGEAVDLEALTDNDYHFVRWTGDNGTIADTTSNSTTITMNGDYTITAQFSVDTYTLTIQSTSGGEVTAPEEGNFEYEVAEEVTLTADPYQDYHFVRWTGDNGTIADTQSAQTSITIEGDYTITAEFDIDTYTLTVTSTAGGTVIEPGENSFTYDSGETVEIESIEDQNYTFVRWTGDNGTIAETTSNTTTITIEGDYTITAEFSRIEGVSIEIISPDEGAVINESEVTLEWDSENVDYHEVKIDDEAWIDVGEDTTCLFDELKDGGHTVRVRGVMEGTEPLLAGVGGLRASDEKTESVTFTIDTAPPIINILTPEGGSTFEPGSIESSWNGSDEISGIAHYEVKIDDGTWQEVGEDINYTFSDLDKGSHTVYVRGLDEAGNSAEDSAEFEVTDGKGEPGGPLEGKSFFGLLAAVIVAILVALLLLLGRFRKRRDVIVTAPTDQEVDSAGSSIYEFTIDNPGDDDEIYELSISTSNEGWTAIAPERISVPEDSTDRVEIQVNIPEDTKEGDSTDITLSATSQSDTDVSDSDAVRVEYRYTFEEEEVTEERIDEALETELSFVKELRSIEGVDLELAKEIYEEGYQNYTDLMEAEVDELTEEIEYLDLALAERLVQVSQERYSQNVEVEEEKSKKPVALAGEDMTVQTGEALELDASESVDESGIESYEWRLEGETIGQEEKISYTFDEPGEYNVELIVTNLEGYTDDDMVYVTVKGEGKKEGKKCKFCGAEVSPSQNICPICQEPIEPGEESAEHEEHPDEVKKPEEEINAIAGKDKVVKLGEKFPLIASQSTSGLDIVSYEWKMDDEKVEFGERITYSFEETGEHTVELTVTDEEGYSDSDELTVHVKEIDQEKDIGDIHDELEDINEEKGYDLPAPAIEQAVDKIRENDISESRYEGILSEIYNERSEVQEEEEKVIEEKKPKIEDGLAYILKDARPEKAMDIAVGRMETKGDGLIATSVQEDKVNETFELEKEGVEYYCLTDKEGTSNLDPGKLDVIADRIIRFFEDGGQTAFLELSEPMLSDNPFNKIMGLINNLIDVAEYTDGALIISLDPDLISKDKLSLVEKKMEELSLQEDEEQRSEETIEFDEPTKEASLLEDKELSKEIERETERDLSKEQLIEEEGTPPTAEAGESRTVKAGETVTFDGSESNDEKGIVSYEWYFDEFETAFGEEVEREFQEPGKHTVKLVVTNEYGFSDKDEIEVMVEEPEEATKEEQGEIEEEATQEEVSEEKPSEDEIEEGKQEKEDVAEEGPEDIPLEDALEELTQLRGLGPSKAERLYKNGYRSIEDLKNASKEELKDIKGVGPALSEQIFESLEELEE